MRKKSIVTGALILTLAGIITRLMGFVYRIYMSNVIGAKGMGLYQLIMPVYGLAWSIACSGFTTTVSELTAQERAKGEDGNMNAVLRLCVTVTTCAGLLLCTLLFMFAESVAVYFLRDARAVMPLKIVSLALPFMTAGGAAVLEPHDPAEEYFRTPSFHTSIHGRINSPPSSGSTA